MGATPELMYIPMPAVSNLPLQFFAEETADDCSASKMLATATAYKNAHTNAQGCFFL